MKRFSSLDAALISALIDNKKWLLSKVTERGKAETPLAAAAISAALWF